MKRTHVDHRWVVSIVQSSVTFMLHTESFNSFIASNTMLTPSLEFK